MIKKIKLLEYIPNINPIKKFKIWAKKNNIKEEKIYKSLYCKKLQ